MCVNGKGGRKRRWVAACTGWKALLYMVVRSPLLSPPLSPTLPLPPSIYLACAYERAHTLPLFC